jgi:hypothetical protein
MKMLDMINRIQLFQIAGDRVNNQLIHRKKMPVFQLGINKPASNQVDAEVSKINKA